MIDTALLGLALALLLGLDLLTFATRAAYLQISHARLLSLRDQVSLPIHRAIGLIPLAPRLKASLNLFLVLTRLLLAGGLISLVQQAGWQVAANVIGWLALVFAGLVLFWLEWWVERRVLLSPERWAVRLAPVARVFISLTAPFLLPLGLQHEPPVNPETANLVTENELKTLVDAGQEEGVFEQDERRMIYSVFDLGTTLAREIMVPRIDMTALEADASLSEAADTLLRSGHSRVPVFDETVDNTLGLLYAKDLLRVWREGSDQIQSLRDLLRPAYFIPEAKKVDELLAEMQAQSVHMAIVVDEYGGVAGLVTLEDIVEEILGDIRDEYDQGEEAPYQDLHNGEYLFLGRVDMDDFNEVMGSDLPTEETDTLGGFIYSQLGHVPGVGETVQRENLLLTVEQVSARRIQKVRARWIQPEEKLAEGEDQDADG